jgi:hypothetical protein
VDDAGRHAGEDCVAILPGGTDQGGAGNGVHAAALTEEIEHVDAPAAKGNLLQRNRVGVQLVDDLCDALEVELPVAADAKMDVVGSEANFSESGIGAVG